MPRRFLCGESVLSCCPSYAMRDEQGCSLVSLVIRPSRSWSDLARGCESVLRSPEGCPDSPPPLYIDPTSTTRANAVVSVRAWSLFAPSSLRGLECRCCSEQLRFFLSLPPSSHDDCRLMVASWRGTCRSAPAARSDRVCRSQGDGTCEASAWGTLACLSNRLHAGSYSDPLRTSRSSLRHWGRVRALRSRSRQSPRVRSVDWEIVPSPGGPGQSLADRSLASLLSEPSIWSAMYFHIPEGTSLKVPAPFLLRCPDAEEGDHHSPLL